MNGILPERSSRPTRSSPVRGAPSRCLRPEYELGEAAEDLGMLAKQGGTEGKWRMMASMLAVSGRCNMKDALERFICARRTGWA